MPTIWQHIFYVINFLSTAWHFEQLSVLFMLRLNFGCEWRRPGKGKDWDFNFTEIGSSNHIIWNAIRKVFIILKKFILILLPIDRSRSYRILIRFSRAIFCFVSQFFANVNILVGLIMTCSLLIASCRINGIEIPRVPQTFQEKSNFRQM